MEATPLISVIVPVYNVEKYLNRCVDSILNQTYSNLEVILVDDGSPDNSGVICDEYAAKDSRIRVIHQENAGVSAARNAGLDACTGEYIAFVDSDDYVDERLFADCRETIGEWNPDLIDWGIRFVDNQGQEKRIQRRSLPKNALIEREMIAEKIIPQLIHTAPVGSDFLAGWICNKLFRKTIIERVNLRFNTDIKVWEDGIFTIEYIGQCCRLVCLEGVYYNYRDTPNSLSEKNDPEIYKYAISIYSNYRDLYEAEYDFENHCSRKYRVVLAHGIICRTLSYVKSGSETYKTARTGIKSMLRDKTFSAFYTATILKNPSVFVTQLLVKMHLVGLAASVFVWYHKLKSSS